MKFICLGSFSLFWWFRTEILDRSKVSGDNKQFSSRSGVNGGMFFISIEIPLELFHFNSTITNHNRQSLRCSWI